MARTETLSVYLLAESVHSPADALKVPIRELREHAVRAEETTGRLFVQTGAQSEPDWVRLLRPVTAPPVTDVTQSLSAILFLQARSRWFAITFGHARHLLETDAYERDFGLMVALNSVDPERLRGAEARTFNQYALHTLRQLSRLSTLESLEIDTQRDLIVSLAGGLVDPALGKRVDGRDAVRLTAELDPADLRAKCGELYELSRQTGYRANFPFFDTIKAVRKPAEINRLNARAFDALGRRRDMASFDLFPPEVVSEEIVAFRMLPEARGLTTVAEPDSRLLRYPLRGPLGPDAVKRELERHRLRGIDANGDPVAEWTFLECLHWEFQDGNTTFVLDRGRWYRVDAALARDVDDFVRTVSSSGRVWPAAAIGEREDHYNTRASRPDLALLDQRFIKLPGQSKIEACDLFSDARQFIHVKHRKGGSAPLSHLFAQAMVSAEAFVTELEFRRLLRVELEEALPGFGQYSPDRVDARNYSIVLALITTPGAVGNVVEKLPFFSRLMLRLAVRRLRSMGFTVHVDEIETSATAPSLLPAPPAPPRRRAARTARRAGSRAPAPRSS